MKRKLPALLVLLWGCGLTGADSNTQALNEVPAAAPTQICETEYECEALVEPCDDLDEQACLADSDCAPEYKLGVFDECEDHCETLDEQACTAAPDCSPEYENGLFDGCEERCESLDEQACTADEACQWICDDDD